MSLTSRARQFVSADFQRFDYVLARTRATAKPAGSWRPVLRRVLTDFCGADPDSSPGQAFPTRTTAARTAS